MKLFNVFWISIGIFLCSALHSDSPLIVSSSSHYPTVASYIFKNSGSVASHKVSFLQTSPDVLSTANADNVPSKYRISQEAISLCVDLVALGYLLHILNKHHESLYNQAAKPTASFLDFSHYYEGFAKPVDMLFFAAQETFRIIIYKTIARWIIWLYVEDAAHSAHKTFHSHRKKP